MAWLRGWERRIADDWHRLVIRTRSVCCAMWEADSWEVQEIVAYPELTVEVIRQHQRSLLLRTMLDDCQSQVVQGCWTISCGQVDPFSKLCCVVSRRTGRPWTSMCRYEPIDLKTVWPQTRSEDPKQHLARSGCAPRSAAQFDLVQLFRLCFSHILMFPLTVRRIVYPRNVVHAARHKECSVR